MPLKRIKQPKSSLKENILEELTLFMGMKGMEDVDQVAVARRLGYKKDVFSQIKSGHSNGSAQLLVSLRLLKELTSLKENHQPAPDDLVELKERIADLEKVIKSGGAKYETLGSLRLNELSSDQREKIGAEILEVVGRHLKNGDGAH